MKVEVKLRNNQILKFKKVKDIFLDNGFLIIEHQIEKNKNQFEPIHLENINYWIESSNKRKCK